LNEIKTALTRFIEAPELKFLQGEYSFSYFRFSEEKIIPGKRFNFPEDKILGKQAEYCFESYLIASKRYQLLAANIQIQGERQTLGELDFLVFDREAEKVLHIELACKFYLFDPRLNEEATTGWIGPNRKDSLNDKLNKLVNSQFPLLQAEETFQKLKDSGIDTASVESQLCLKAFLFVPKNIPFVQFEQNYQDCIVGYWIPFSEFISEDKTALYAIPKKKEWLLPHENIEAWHTFSEALSLLKTETLNNKSPLVYKKTSTELLSFFVVWW
jgi:hypothetical protein